MLDTAIRVRPVCGPGISGRRTTFGHDLIPRCRGKGQSRAQPETGDSRDNNTTPPVAERVSVRRDAMTSYPVQRDDDGWCDGRCDVGGIIIMLSATLVRSRSGPRRRAHTRAYTFTRCTVTLSSTYRNKYVYVRACTGCLYHL